MSEVSTITILVSELTTDERLEILGTLNSQQAGMLLHLSVWLRGLEHDLPEGTPEKYRRHLSDILDLVEGTYFGRTQSKGLMDLAHEMSDLLPASGDWMPTCLLGDDPGGLGAQILERAGRILK